MMNLKNVAVGVIIVALITFIFYSAENFWKINDATLNDVVAYYNLHGEYPTIDGKTNLIDIDLLYGDNVPSKVKEKLINNYDFYLSFERIEKGKVLPTKNGDVAKVTHTKEKYNIKDLTNNDSVLTWTGPESGDIFEWQDDQWVYISKFKNSKFIYADPEKEYAIGNYGFHIGEIEFNVVPLIQLKEESGSK